MQTSDFWSGKKVLVCGGSGFIGSHLTMMLVDRGARVTATTHSLKRDKVQVNLKEILPYIKVVTADLTQTEDCAKICKNQDLVVNAAHVDGSASYKKAHPAFILRQNLLMTLNILEACRFADVQRLLILSSAEVYSPETTIPIRET